MDSKTILKMAMIEKNLKSGEVADLLQIDRQVFYNKLSRNSMSVSELSEILDKLGFVLCIREK